MFLELHLPQIKCIFIFALLVTLAGRTLSETDDIDEDEWEEEEPESAKVKVPPGVQTISYNPADLTDEDQHSTHMPRDLTCDGCRIVAYLMTQKLQKFQKRQKEGRKISESDLIDILDDVCMDKEKKFEGYGIKEVEGKRRLSGEGLETQDVAGVMQSGGRWPFRLHQMCAQYLGELGEDEIYEAFLDKKSSVENLLCHSKENGNICPPKKKKGAKKPKSEL